MAGFILLHRDLIDKPIWQNSTPEQKVILITLLTMATWKETQWDWNGNKFKLLPGQFVSSLPKIAEKCGKEVSVQNVRTALARFKKLEFLTDESTAHGRLITIANWRVYQDQNFEANRQTNSCLTDDQQTPNRPLTDDQQTPNRPLTDGQQTNNKQDNNIKIKQDKKSTIPPIVPQGDDVGAAEKSPKSDGAQRKKAGRANMYEYTPEFEAFWAVYPRNADKVSGFAKFKECLKAGTTVEELTVAAQNYANYIKLRHTPEDKILHAKTFLGPAKRYTEFVKGIDLFGKSTDDDRNVQGENAGKPDWSKHFTT